ncbi:hypothetical protein Ancab_014332 [Ancistrocladus abbreviatus]
MILLIAKEEVRKLPVAPLGLEMTLESPSSISGTVDTDRIIVITLTGKGPPLEGFVNGVGFKHKTTLQAYGIPSSMIKWKRREGFHPPLWGNGRRGEEQCVIDGWETYKRVGLSNNQE